jgi:hypothetical protein
MLLDVQTDRLFVCALAQSRVLYVQRWALHPMMIENLGHVHGPLPRRSGSLSGEAFDFFGLGSWEIPFPM